jgi:hypothetical protein
MKARRQITGKKETNYWYDKTPFMGVALTNLKVLE